MFVARTLRRALKGCIKTSGPAFLRELGGKYIVSLRICLYYASNASFEPTNHLNPLYAVTMLGAEKDALSRSWRDDE
jgi:hypothetical protein